MIKTNKHELFTKNIGLDAFRAVCVLLVLWAHLIPAFFVSWMPAEVSNLVVNFSGMGSFGVTAFFLLSAFLLVRIYDKPGIHTKQGKKDFYLNRILRIFPLYFLLLLSSTVAQLVGRGGVEAPNWQYLSSAFFVFNWTSFIEPANLIAHLWSVCVEMQFYVVLPFLLIIPSKHRITVLWVVIAAAPILRLVTDNYFAYPAVWNFTSSQVDAFAAGALLATLLNVSSPKLAATTRKINTIAGKLVLALLIGLFALANALLGPIIVFASALNTISYSFAVLLSASLLLVCISLKSENRVMAWLGKRSYGIYLFHWPLITIALTFGIGTIMSPPLVGVVILAITLGLAWISYKYYETPFLKKKQSKS